MQHQTNEPPKREPSPFRAGRRSDRKTLTLILLTTLNDIGAVEKMVAAVVNDTAGNLFNHNYLLEPVSDPDLSNPKLI
jgi:hypothetical protein